MSEWCLAFTRRLVGVQNCQGGRWEEARRSLDVLSFFRVYGGHIGFKLKAV